MFVEMPYSWWRLWVKFCMLFFRFREILVTNNAFHIEDKNHSMFEHVKLSEWYRK